MKTGIKQELLSNLYPKSYLIQYNISKIRWLILIALIFINWIYATVLFVINSIIYIVVPEQDDIKNMKIMLIALGKDMDRESNILRNKIGDFLYKCGEDDMYRFVGVFFSLHMTDNSITKGVILNISEFKIDEKILSKRYEVKFEKEVSINNRFPSRYYTLSPKELDDIIQENLLGSNVYFIYKRENDNQHQDDDSEMVFNKQK